MFKKISLAVAVLGLTLAFQALASAQGTAVYDPATGKVTLNGVTNVGGIRVSGPSVPVNPPNALGGFTETIAATNTVNWLLFVPLNGDGHNLGNVFPTGLLQTTLAQSYFAGVVITGSGNPEPVGIPLTGGIIPEPGTLALTGSSLLGLLAFRRRRSA